MQAQEKEKGAYHPIILENQKSVEKESGTTIKLMKIKRKSGFSVEDLSYSLSSYFQVFNEKDFKAYIYHNSNSPFQVTNDLRYKNIDELVHGNIPGMN